MIRGGVEKEWKKEEEGGRECAREGMSAEPKKEEVEGVGRGATGKVEGGHGLEEEDRGDNGRKRKRRRRKRKGRRETGS